MFEFLVALEAILGGAPLALIPVLVDARTATVAIFNNLSFTIEIGSTRSCVIVILPTSWRFDFFAEHNLERAKNIFLVILTQHIGKFGYFLALFRTTDEFFSHDGIFFDFDMLRIPCNHLFN